MGACMNKEQILDYLKNKKQFLQEHFGISKIGLFGSYARDESTKNSDIDIIYEIDKDKKFSMFAYLKLNKYLEESFHAKVDLVRETAIKESLKSYISKDIIYV